MISRFLSQFRLLLALTLTLAVILTGTLPLAAQGDDPPDRAPNRLITESSPYLLQHAYNPVDWYPWGEEAFAAAQEQNKPIFLSIGYSSCHWCHVMREESFEDEEVAALMNETFISIKVDREERPDIDAVYMNVALMLNGSGGWPLTILLTPDGDPFFAGTYLPRTSRFERVGMIELIGEVQTVWNSEPERITSFGADVSSAVQDVSYDQPGAALGEAALDDTYGQLLAEFDPVMGGFGTAPKFPSPHNLLFLLRYWDRSGAEEALVMVETTLTQMRLGGLYDQVGHGFHRYSVDAAWAVPHFEKMLYDQALLSMAYTEAYLATGDPFYARTARETLDFVLAEMTGPEGGFYSAFDADSEGEEGRFYLWTEDEVRAVLPPDDAEFVISTFNLAEEGNFRDPVTREYTGANIPYLVTPLDDEDAARWEAIRPVLYAARAERVPPALDDKVLTDWNGLMIAALAQAARAYDEPAYAEAAVRGADFLLATMVDDDGRLLHRYRNGEAGIMGTLDDYAFLIWGLLELYETTFDVRYLEAALELQDVQLAYFWDDDNGGFFMTADDAEDLLTRPKEIFDTALPAGNSVSMLNLLRLGRITGNVAYEETAAALTESSAGILAQIPSGATMLLAGVDFAVGPSYEIVIVGEPDAADTLAMLDALHGVYVPNKVVLQRTPGDDAPIIALAEFTLYQRQ
ncbi:MAG: thioredoxin domain-containing protein, partial [Chloroflexi bacterium]|nr:thioredoxin domain-containing protein [Chloroflexota bacterium]